METESQIRPEALSSLLSLGKDEMNFAEHPMAMVSDRVTKGKNSIEFEYKDYDERRKRAVIRRRVIEGSEKYGLPTATDDTVVLALIQLTKIQSDFSNKEVMFSRRELIEILGWPDDGRSYRRIKESLLRIFGVNYIYDNAWWDNRQKAWTTKAFHILEIVEINDSRTSNEQRSLFPSRVVWNDIVFDSFQAGFLRDIDFTLCIKLEHPIALRLYRFLGKRFYKQAEWDFDLKELAWMFVGLGQNYEGNAHIARKLQPAIAELEKMSFLEPLSPKERFLKKGRNWRIRFVQKRVVPALADQQPTVDEPKPPQQVEELIARGVESLIARKLVAAHPLEEVQLQIEYYDWAKEGNAKKGEKPEGPGWLVRAIPGKYRPPKEFKTSEQRKREAETSQEKQRKAAEAKRLQAEKEAREERERQARKSAVEAHLAGLAAEERKRLDVEFRAEGNHGPGKIPFADALFRNFIAKKLGLLEEAESQT